MLVVMGHLLGSVVVGATGLVLVQWTVADPTVVHATSLGGYLAVVGTVAILAYAGAVRRFDRLTLDDL